MQNPPGLKITLKDWDEFRYRALDSELICFDLKDSTFYCHAILENKIYIYSEQTPETTLELDEMNNNVVLSGVKISGKDEQLGMELKANKIKNAGGVHRVQYELDLLYTKNWLSRELGIHRDFIVQGNIEG